MNITIHPDLATQLEAHVKQSGEFPSVEAYVNYVLTEVLKQTANAPQEAGAYTAEQEADVKKRLEDLGYLD